MSNQLNLLFIGDIVSDSGIALLDTFLPSLIQKYRADFVIVNGENAHEGMGTNEQIVKHFYSLGAHVITGGNHSFAKWKVYGYMKTDPKLLRPLNYPKGAHGFGYGIYEIPGLHQKIGVINLQGRTFMQPLDDPFRTADWVIDKIKEETNLIFVDFHAEATAEKQAFAWYVDGRASVVVGTHTHVPTNDYRILPKGTGYITDVGMTGAFNSVIGMDKDTAIKRFLLQTPHKYSSANGDNRLCGLFSKINLETGKCVHIEPVIVPSFKTQTEE
ncbi:MAG: TIGR00282 family metallophosphoesterase [Balneolales bacterium]|nr:TIGR00282 family metallophosphoesterase [Balneolales bacterium]